MADFNNSDSNRKKTPSYYDAIEKNPTGRPLLDDFFDDVAVSDNPRPPQPPQSHPDATVRLPQTTPPFVSHSDATVMGRLDTNDYKQARAVPPPPVIEDEIIDFNSDSGPFRSRRNVPPPPPLQFEREPAYSGARPESVGQAMRQQRPYTRSDAPADRTRVIGSSPFPTLDDEPEEDDAPPPPPVNPAELVAEPIFNSNRTRPFTRAPIVEGQGRRRGLFTRPMFAVFAFLIAMLLVAFIVLIVFSSGRNLERAGNTDRFTVLIAPIGEGSNYAPFNDNIVWQKGLSDNLRDRGGLPALDVRSGSSLIKDPISARKEDLRTSTDAVVWGYFDRSTNKLYSYITVVPNGPFDPPVGRGREVFERSFFDSEQVLVVSGPPSSYPVAKSPLTELLSAIYYNYSGNYDTALATVTQLVNTADADSLPGLRFLRGNILIGFGRNAQAVDDYDAVVKANNTALSQNKAIPVNPTHIYNNRGFTYKLMGRFKESEENFRAALGFPQEVARKDLSKRLDTPGDRKDLPKVYTNYVQMIVDQGRTEFNPTEQAEFLAGLNDVLKIEPKSSLAWHYLGKIYRFQGNYDQADAAQGKARELDDNYLEAHNEIGMDYLLKYERASQPDSLNAAFAAYQRGSARASDITNQNVAHRQTLINEGRQILAVVWDVRILETTNYLNRMRLGEGVYYLEVVRRNGIDLGNPFDKFLRWIKSEKVAVEEAGPRLKQSVEAMPDDPASNFYYGQYLALTGEGDPLPYYQKAKDLEKNLDYKFRYYDRLAKQYAAIGKPNEAIKEYNDYIGLDKGRSAGYAARAAMQAQFGQNKEAIASAEEAIRLDQRNPNNYLVAGKAQLKLGQPEIAVNYFDRAIVLDPNLTEAYTQRGIAILNLNRREEALASFAKALSLDDNQAEPHFYSGLLYIGPPWNDAARARKEWEKATALNPSYFEAWVKLGQHYSQYNELDRAIEAYNKALAINEKDAAVHYYIGLLYEVKGNWPEAEKQYRRAVELQPGLINARTRLAEAIKRNGGKPEDMIAQALEAVKLAPKSVEAWVELGNIYLSRSQYDDAIKSFETAIKVKGDSAEAFYGRALGLQAKGQTDPALRDVNEAVRLRANWIEALSLQASLLTAKGQLDEAAKSMEKARAIDPNNPTLLSQTGTIAELKGDGDGAIKAYEASLKVSEPQAEVHFKVGRMYFQRRNFPVALSHFQRTRQLNENYEHIDYWLGRTLAFSGANGDAQKALEQAIKKEPNFVEAHYELGSLYGIIGKLDLAMAQFDEATKLQPAFGLAWLGKAQVLEQLLRGPEAKAAYQQAAKSSDPQTQQAANDALRRLGG